MINDYNYCLDYVINKIIEIVNDHLVTLVITALMLIYIVLKLNKKYKFNKIFNI